MMAKHNHRCHQKDIFCLFYYVRIHISQILTFWNNIQGCYLTQLVWCAWIVFHLFWYVSIFHLLIGRYDDGICWNKLQTRIPWLSRVTNGLECYLLFQIPNLVSEFVASLEYLYGVLKLDHTILCQTNIRTKYLEHILHLVPLYYDLFKQVLSNFIFLYIYCWQELIFTTTHAQTFGF